MAGKYDHIDFKPPKSVADAAARGLALRQKAKKSQKGGLSTGQAAKEGVGSGVQRAVNLKNRNKMSPETVRRMLRFFQRHEKSSKIDKGKTPITDKGYQAHLLWGGNPGYAWARKIVRQMESADRKSKEQKKKAAVEDFILSPQLQKLAYLEPTELVEIANFADENSLLQIADICDELLWG